MTTVFINILNMSLVASLAAILIIFVRLFLKKAPKIYSYALWFVLLFRLLCPFTFETAMGLIPVNTQAIPQDIVFAEHPHITSGITVIDNAVNRTIETSVLPMNPTASVNPMGDLSAQKVENVVKGHFEIDNFVC